MKKLLAVFLSFFALVLSAQQTEVDLVINHDPLNSEYSAKKLLNAFIGDYKWNCLSVNVVESFDAGNSPYVLEVWEEKEFLSNYAYKEQKTTPATASGRKEKKWTEGGMRVRTLINYFGRLTERETDSVLEVFKVIGNIDKDIVDDEVKAKIKPKYVDNKDLNEAMLVKHEKKILEYREEIQKVLQDHLGNAIVSCMARRLLGPVEFTKIVEKDKDKVKKLGYEHCGEKPLEGDGGFTTTCFSKEELNGVHYYVDQGGVYPDVKAKGNVFSVRGGKKEILAAHKAGNPLVIGHREYMEPYDLAENKDEDLRRIAFIFLHESLLYTDLDKTKLELFMQSLYLGIRDIQVLRSNPVLDQDAKDVDVSTLSGLQMITANILDMKKSLYEKKTSPVRVAKVNLSATGLSETKYKSETEIAGLPNKSGSWQFDFSKFKVGDIDRAILENEIELVGIIEQEKKEVKKVLIRTILPIAKGKIKVYDKKRINKKTKEIATLKIKEITGRYTAIAEVDKGKKELLPILNSKKVLTLKFEGAGLFSGDGVELFRGMFTYK